MASIKGLPSVLKYQKHLSLSLVSQYVPSIGEGSSKEKCFILDNKLKNSLTRLGIKDKNLYSYLERSKNQEKNNIDKSSIKKIIKKILNK